jgi:membrane fusion protein, copper/silver efflux system
MKTRTLLVALAAAGLLGAIGYGVYRIGLSDGKKMAAFTTGASPEQGATDGVPGRKVLYWHDPMVPGQRFDKPGKSPFMDMQLVPVYADTESDGNTVSISPRIQQNLGMRTAEAVLGAVAQSIEASGSVAFNDAEVAVVQSHGNGVVEKLHVHAAFDAVRKDQPLAEVRLIQSNGAAHRRLTLLAPRAGIVTELGLREGQAVMAGATLFRINGLASVWINAEVPENVSAQVITGGSVSIRVSALPGRTFRGHVNANLPDIATATRTRKVRIEIANADGKLVPGMFATINFESAIKNKRLLVPTDALIRTGTRDVVIVSEGDGHFHPQEVKVGTEAGEQTEILSGLVAGERVVTSGQFLIDSEASMKGVMSRASTGGKP